MTEKKGQSKVIRRCDPGWLGDVPVHQQGLQRLLLTHDAFPGWQFAVSFDGGTAAAFEMAPATQFAHTPLSPRLATPHGGVTARTLRRVPFGELERAARDWERARAAIEVAEAAAETIYLDADGKEIAREPSVPQGGPGSEVHLAAIERHEELTDFGARPGRRGRPSVDYARIARDYVEALGEPDPVAVVARRHDESIKRIRNILYEARHKRGLLTATPKGKAGGELTDEAKQMLAGEED